MTKKRFDGAGKAGRVVAAILTSIALIGLITFNPQAAVPDRVERVELPGLSGAGNNVALAYERYVLVAPYAPSGALSEEAGVDDLDNHFIYLIDTKKPDSEPKAKSLETLAGPDGKSKKVFYPTRLVFDSERSIAYVRGTRYEETDGEIREIEVLAYLRVNLDDNGKPVFGDSVGMIDIRGVEQEETGDAPMDFAIGRNGKQVVFTNGASIFTYDLDHGYIHSVAIVPPSEYGKDSAITYLDIERASNTLTVCWNRRTEIAEGESRYSSEVSFYRLEDDGKLKLLNRVYPEDLPNGGHLTTGSNIQVISDEETGVAEFALLATSDGSLCQIDLDSEEIRASVKSLYVFPELAVETGQASSPRLVQYDRTRKLVGIIKQGFSVQIKRPSNGRPRRGGVGRDLMAYSVVEEPALALARLGKKNKVVSAGAFVSEFSSQGGLSNLVSAGEGQIFVATYAGRLYSLSVGSDIEAAGISEFGDIGTRVERIDYYSNRASLVAINSLEAGEDGAGIVSPGAVVIAKMNQNTVAGAAFTPSFAAVFGPSGVRAPSIRRPCNVKK